jgi:hypothetical protein
MGYTYTTTITIIRPHFRLIGDVLTGTTAGKCIHAVTRPGIGGKARPPAGKYQILAPISHPSLGQVAVVVLLQEESYTISTVPHFAPNMVSGLGTVLPLTYSIASAAGGAASCSPHQGFILTKDNVTAPNAVAVLSGFDELMDTLESSGGAILEILG